MNDFQMFVSSHFWTILQIPRAEIGLRAWQLKIVGLFRLIIMNKWSLHLSKWFLGSQIWFSTYTIIFWVSKGLSSCMSSHTLIQLCHRMCRRDCCILNNSEISCFFIEAILFGKVRNLSNYVMYRIIHVRVARPEWVIVSSSKSNCFKYC